MQALVVAIEAQHVDVVKTLVEHERFSLGDLDKGYHEGFVACLVGGLPGTAGVLRKLLELGFNLPTYVPGMAPPVLWMDTLHKAPMVVCSENI